MRSTKSLLLLEAYTMSTHAWSTARISVDAAIPMPGIVGSAARLPAQSQSTNIIERFFRRLKEECVWQHNFTCFEEDRRTITQWIDWYHTSRPHQALGYKSPVLYHEQKLLPVA